MPKVVGITSKHIDIPPLDAELVITGDQTDVVAINIDDVVIEDDLLYYEDTDEDGLDLVDGVSQYLKDISKYPLYTAEEELDAAVKYAKTRDPAIRNDIVNHNLRLVISIAKKYRSKSLSLLDIIQYGNLGLFKAVDKYDPELGHRFSTYATWWIRQSIVRGLAMDSRSIRIPGYISEQAIKNKKAREELSHSLNRQPTEDELVDYINKNHLLVSSIPEMTKEKLHECNMFFADKTLSINSSIGDEGDDTEFEEMIASEDKTPEDLIIQSSLSENLINAISYVITNDRDLNVILYKYGLNTDYSHSDAEVAKKFHITKEKVRLIESKALRKLRGSKYVRQLLKDYYSVSRVGYALKGF